MLTVWFNRFCRRSEVGCYSRRPRTLSLYEWDVIFRGGIFRLASQNMRALSIEIIDIECVLHHESCLHFLPFQIRHIEFGEEWEMREMPCLRSLRRVKMPFEIRHFWRQIFDWEEIGVRILCLLFLWPWGMRESFPSMHGDYKSTREFII